ncbi:unnamed protein product [Dibothriocephalus latus]|uniref:mitogen-activated protein kinase kinase n=1 Tax=Dibothriocephalus latus TaxID=60516 RepID=A0A3P7NU99_DIBLA|nr:unnamed protein product [Dibothriocephalus latus]
MRVSEEGPEVAVKEINLTQPDIDPHRILNESIFGAKVGDCPYALKSYGCLLHNGTVRLLMEIMDSTVDVLTHEARNGLLRNVETCDFLPAFVQTNVLGEIVPEQFIAYIIKCIVTGLEFLNRECNIHHRDVKPSNMLVDRSGQVKFGRILVPEVSRGSYLSDIRKGGIQQCLKSLHFAPFDDDESVVDVSEPELQGRRAEDQQLEPLQKSFGKKARQRRASWCPLLLFINLAMERERSFWTQFQELDDVHSLDFLICDFGMSKEMIDMKTSTNVGTFLYQAPERLNISSPNRQGFRIQSDVWSLGLSVYRIATNEHPYPQLVDNLEYMTKVLQSDIPTLPEGDEEPEAAASYSNVIRDFLALCLVKEESQRPDFVTLLQSAFLAPVDLASVKPDFAAFVTRILAPGNRGW